MRNFYKSQDDAFPLLNSHYITCAFILKLTLSHYRLIFHLFFLFVIKAHFLIPNIYFTTCLLSMSNLHFPFSVTLPLLLINLSPSRLISKINLENKRIYRVKTEHFCAIELFCFALLIKFRLSKFWTQINIKECVEKIMWQNFDETFYNFITVIEMHFPANKIMLLRPDKNDVCALWTLI